MRWAEDVARLREKRNTYSTLLGNPEGKKPLGRPRCRWVNSMKMIWIGLMW
jgi:hypothetical protein